MRGQRKGRGHLVSTTRRLGASVTAALLLVLGAGVLEGGSPASALTATTTTLMSSANPSTFGDSVTFTATVTDGTSPTGTVAFEGGGITGCDAVPLDGTGVATCTLTTLPVESAQTVTATYSGDTTNGTSFGTVSQTVNKVHHEHRRQLLRQPLDGRPERHLHGDGERRLEPDRDRGLHRGPASPGATPRP